MSHAKQKGAVAAGAAGAPLEATATAALEATLRTAGLRATKPRIAVLRFLTENGSPTSHAELIEALGGEGYERATLYRNLISLAEAHLVTRTDLGDHVWRFELRRGGAAGAGAAGSGARKHSGEHPHFVCTACGGVSCLEGVSVRIGGANVPRAVGQKGVSVQLSGVCDACN